MASHTINTRSLAALVAITQNVFLARSLRAPICGHVTTAECRYTLVLQALCSIEFLAHVTFTSIGQIQLPAQFIFIPREPRTKFSPCPLSNRAHSSVGPRPANAGTRNSRGLTHLTQDSNKCCVDRGISWQLSCCVFGPYLWREQYRTTKQLLGRIFLAR